jgi:hypothetical protein
MVYNTQNYWVFRLFQSSGILETSKHDVSETDLFPSSGEEDNIRIKLRGMRFSELDRNRHIIRPKDGPLC